MFAGTPATAGSRARSPPGTSPAATWRTTASCATRPARSLPSPASSGSSPGSRAEAQERGGVAAEDLLELGVGQLVGEGRDGVERVRPGGVLVRVVGLEHDLVDADRVAQREAGG